VAIADGNPEEEDVPAAGQAGAPRKRQHLADGEAGLQRARVGVLQSNTFAISSMPTPSFSERSR
jgi:hypothetical protein